MKIIFILVNFFLFSIILFSQTNNNWVKLIKENQKISINDINKSFENSGKKWEKHFYRWQWANNYNENSVIVNKNNLLQNYIDKYTKSKSGSTNGNWSPLGPTSWVNVNSGYNPGNGRINAVTVDPNNSNIIYVCAASGGLWKSNDGGQSWNSITDNLPVLGTSDIAINPQNSNVIYLATGDRDGYDTYGMGVFKSTDGGTTWLPTGLYVDELNQSYIVNCIEINYQNPDIIYAGTKSGLYRTEDRGNTWTAVIPFGNFYEVKLNPLNPNTVFAARSDRFFKSTNNGISFQTMYNFPINAGRIAFDVTPNDTSYIYAIIATTSYDFMGVYKSTDAGQTWIEKVNVNDINLLGYSETGNDDASQAWYDLAIAVSPLDKNIVYTGGINIWKSANGGEDWYISSKWYYTGVSEIYSHADIHSLDFYGNKLFCGSDGGVFKKPNNSGWQNLSFGLNISQIYRFSNSFDGTKVSIGCQDNGTNIFTQEWQHILGADGMETIIDNNNLQIVYSSIYFGNIYKSTSGGGNNYKIFDASDYEESSGWITPYIIDKNNSNILIVGAENIYKTTDQGNSWKLISDFADTSNITALAISHNENEYIYAAKGNTLYKTNNEYNWTKLSISIPNKIVSIRISNNNPEHIAVLSSSSSKCYVAISKDGGQTFETPYSYIEAPGNDIALSNNDDGIYVATNFGVLYIDKNLTDWISFNKNMPIVKISELEILPEYNKIRAATYGRGVWESDLYLPLSANKNTTVNEFYVYPNPVQDILFVDVKSLDVSKVIVFSSAGLKIYETNKIDSTLKINVSDYVKGSYFVKLVYFNGKNSVKKFVKM